MTKPRYASTATLRFGFTGSSAEESMSHRLRIYSKDSVLAFGYSRPHRPASKQNRGIAMHSFDLFGPVAIAVRSMMICDEERAGENLMKNDAELLSRRGFLQLGATTAIATH